jgi:hypothetical protein
VSTSSPWPLDLSYNRTDRILRVRFDDGEPRECAFKAGTASFADTNGAAMPGERDPLFVRGPKREAAGECGLIGGEEVVGADGEVIGWLTTDDEC